MKLFNSFLIFISAFMLLLGFILFFPTPSNISAIPHPEFSHILRSGVSIMAFSSVKWLGIFFGLGILCLFGFFAFIGLHRKSKEQNRNIIKYLRIGMSLYILTYALLQIVYHSYYQGHTDIFFLGFPAPTATMLFALGLSPLLITFFYIWKFDSWVISQNDIEKFKKIIETPPNTNA